MGEIVKRIVRLFREFWSKVDVNHKLTVIFLMTLLIVGALSMIYYSSKPALGPLYYGLDMDSASAVKEFLDEEQVQYKIKDGGKAIYVPKNKIYSLRLALAGKGLPKKGQSVGFEIFDKTNLGMTEFVQKINYYRAVQGELSRTISNIDGVEAARVHIVMPEESIFKEDQKEATASLALSLRSHGILDVAQIAGIRQLVASSVEGLKAGNISIIDNWGNMLSQPTSGENTIGDLATSQIGIQQAIENHYVKKIQSLLFGVLGNNNAVVRVNASINFDKVEKTLESYNPESAVVRQETITTETSSGKSATGEGPPGVQANIREGEGREESLKQQSATSREVIKNVYEINKTIEHVIKGVGDIQNLMVSVFIRQRTETDEEGNVKPAPRDAAELTAFEDTVKNAMGFDEQRGDRVAVKEIAFSTPEIPSSIKALEGAAKKASLMNMIRVILGGIAVILLVFMAFSFLKKVKVEDVGVGPVNHFPGMEDMPVQEVVAGAGEAAETAMPGVVSDATVARMVERQPEESALIMQKWMNK